VDWSTPRTRAVAAGRSRAAWRFGILDRENLVFAEHGRSDSGPIETDAIERVAGQLDLALAMSEVYRSDPSFAAPQEVWERLRDACPDLLG
jgi:hypothetical protein